MKKIKKLHKKIIAGASSGILAGVLLFGGSVYADTAEYARVHNEKTPVHQSDTRMHLLRRQHSNSKIYSLARSLGMTHNEIRDEIRSGKTVKEILQEHGITGDQINQL